MKKFYLFSAGLLLASLPMYAQIEVPDGPKRTDQDAKVIFEQGFEADWNEWSTKVVDKIDKLYYYAHTGDSGVTSISSSWTEIIERTDSVIEMKNGVVQSDLAADEGAFNNDRYTIYTDQTTDRLEELQKFGIDPGKHYFSYTSDVKLANTGNAYSSGVVENYRRNLFVRGLPIDDNSSYRLTMYIKVNNSSASVTPTFYADVMRGYFHSEKPFTTGSNQFEYKQTSFTGNWEKVTFMTYYINDSVQETLYNKQYWWAGNEWGWKPEGAEAPMYFIKQPDKYFVRLSFASDSTEFLVDNISLTKSWIGGVEYWGDKIRVDFGYKTNLKDLAKAAYAKTNIDAVQLPGEYFSVLGYYNPASHGETGDGMWYEIPINSAEYHGDGYMYMWTAEDEEGETYKFDYYDTVLVNFTNPVDKEDLCLTYTDANLYPMADDTIWAKDGKKVPSFSNELATPNQFVFDNVYSMMDRPPVFQGAPFENGSFGLDGSIRELNIKFSKKIEFEPNATEQSTLAFCRVTGPTGKEIWTVKEATDSSALFVRPENKTEKLEGAYQFEFLYLKGKTTEYGETFTLNYEFGPFDKHPNADPIFATDWRKDTKENQAVPAGFSIWDKSDGYKVGDGSKLGSSGTKARVYYTNPAESNGLDCGFYISSRGQKQGGHIYYGTEENFALNLAAGKYSITFSAANWDGYEVPISIYVYPKSAFVLENNVPAIPANARKLVATFTPSKKASSSDIQNYDEPYGKWESEVFAFDFKIDTDGDYILEFESAMGESGNAQSYGGMLMGNISITKSLGLSFASVSAFNKAMDAALAKMKAAEEVKDGITPYKGAQYNKFKALVESYDGWEDTAPSKYAETVATIEQAIKDMQARMDLVDKYFKSYDGMVSKVAEFEELTDLHGLEAYQVLLAIIDDYEGFDTSKADDGMLNDYIAAFDSFVKALDDRKALNDKWQAKLDEIEGLLTDSLASKSLPEYELLASAYDDALGQDVIGPSDSQFEAIYDNLCIIVKDYVFTVEFIEAMTRQIKELFALNELLGDDFNGKKDELKQIIDDMANGGFNAEDNISMMRALIASGKYYIIKAFSENNNVVNGLDISCIVPNYYMTTAAIPGVDMRKNSSGKWVIETPSTTAIPCWTLSYAGAYGSSGAAYPGKEAMDWESDVHTFIAGFHIENNTTGKAEITVEGMPVGYYNVAMNMGEVGVSNSYVTITTDSTSYKEKPGKAKNFFFGGDSIFVNPGSKLTASYEITGASGSGHCQVNGIQVKITAPLAGYDYSADLKAAKAKFDEIITFNAPVSQEKSYKIFNLNGMQINGAKSGQIIIRQSVRENGSVVTEKILAE